MARRIRQGDGPSNTITLALVDTPLVGVGTQAALRVLLPFEAPAGGAVVSLTSDDPRVATLSPASDHRSGSEQADVTVNGLAVGTTTLTATAAGYADGTLTISVTNSVLSVPATLTAPLGASPRCR